MSFIIISHSLGRVGIEPQIRGSEDHPVVVFSLATNHRFKRGDDFVTSTDWHNVAVFKPSLRQSVEQNVTKGKRVGFELILKVR